MPVDTAVSLCRSCPFSENFFIFAKCFGSIRCLIPRVHCAAGDCQGNTNGEYQHQDLVACFLKDLYIEFDFEVAQKALKAARTEATSAAVSSPP